MLLMRPTVRLNSNLILNWGVLGLLSFVCLFSLAGCQSAEPVINRKDKLLRKVSNQKIFYARYDSVWRAAQLSLKYPVAINNMDNGVLETDYIKAVDGYSPPHENKVPSSGVRYKITLILVKGKVDGRESVRVTVGKVTEKKRDFFSDPEAMPTDGLEESVILYRIERELQIEEALKKAAKSQG